MFKLIKTNLCLFVCIKNMCFDGIRTIDIGVVKEIKLIIITHLPQRNASDVKLLNGCCLQFALD